MYILFVFYYAFSMLGKGPKTVKLFINLTKTMDFDSAETFQAVQTLEYAINTLHCYFDEVLHESQTDKG